MKIVMLIAYSTLAFGGFSDIPGEDRYDYKKSKVQSPKKVRRPQVRKDNSINKALEELARKDRAIAELLQKQEESLIIRKKQSKITALTRLRAILLNSVLAMNVRPSKFIVRIGDPSSDLDGAELRCVGFSFEKRVPSKCDLLVMEGKEIEVDVELWDLDGAQGIIADYYYSGEEKTFLTSSFASFLGATFDVAKGGVDTPFGNVSKNTAKNKIMNGLMGMANNAKEKIVESGERELSISYVNAGKEVLVFFNQSVDLEGENR